METSGEWHAGRAAAPPLFERIAGGASATAQITAVLEFIATCERQQPAETGSGERALRARAAIVGALVALREAHSRHDDRPLPPAELWATVRRWIEGQTFAPRTGTGGVRLLDAAAAPFAELDELRIVGLVEADWPERSTPSIFYPAVAAPPARLAGRRRSARSGTRALPRSAAAAGPRGFRLDLHARRRRDRCAVAVPRRRRPRRTRRPAARADTPRADLRPRSAALRPLRLEVASTAAAEWLAGACRGRQALMRSFHGAIGPRAAASTRSATSSDTSNVRSSTSPRTCSGSRRSGRTSRG